MTSGTGSAPSQSLWFVRQASVSELPIVAPLALHDEASQRRQVILSILKEAVQRGGENLYLALVVDRRSGHAAFGGIALHTSDDAATLLGIGPLANTSAAGEEVMVHEVREAGLGMLLEHLHERLIAAGASFLQAMRPPDRPQRVLERNGYEPLATLDYLVTAAPARAPSTQTAASAGTGADASSAEHAVRFVPYREWFGDGAPSERAEDQLCVLVERTYADSLDCPRLARFRSAADALHTYRQHPGFSPSYWQVVVDSQERAVGCLLMTPYWPTGTLEITYMAVVPEARRRGIGTQCVTQAWRMARRGGLIQLSLAVDRENLLANPLYARHGFRPILSESVWGRRLSRNAEEARPGPHATGDE